MTTSALEERFLTLCRCWRLPEPVREHRFDPVRKWRFDFCWLDAGIAVELEGGVWSRGRHTRGAGFTEDARKYNTAVISGYRVIRLTGEMLNGEVGPIMAWLRAQLGGA